MERLKLRDLRALLDLTRRCHAIRDLDDLVMTVISGVSELIPADVTTYVEADRRSRRIRLRANPTDFVMGHDAALRGAEPHIDEQPVVAHYLRTGDERAFRISDFVTRSQLRRLGIYNDYYRLFGIEYQLSAPVASGRHLLARVTCSRSNPDFSDRERLLLNLLRPHIVEARQNAEALTLLKQAGDASGLGLVVIEGGRVIQANPRALALVQEYFGPAVPSNRLPQSLARWTRHLERLLETADDPPPLPQRLVVDREDKRLTVVLILGAVQSLLILREERTSLRPASLQSLGLTPRETEVLAWVAQGKSNHVVATILGLSYRTVEKHIENILRKLAVENRTAAVTRALTVAYGAGA